MEISQEQLDSIADAIKGLARDFERRTKILADLIEGNAAQHAEELTMRDIAIDDLIAHKRQSTIVIELFRGLHNEAKQLRNSVEDPRDKDVAVSDLQWLVQFIREDNQHNRNESSRLAALERKVQSLEEQNKRKT